MPDIERMDFHGDQISTCKDEQTGKVYCALREIAEDNLGVSWAAQSVKLKASFYQKHITRFDIETSQGKVEALFLNIDLLPTWLLSISPEKVNPAIKDKLLAYQEECAQALREYWYKGAAVNPRTGAPLAGVDPQLLAVIAHGMEYGLRHAVPRMIAERVPSHSTPASSPSSTSRGQSRIPRPRPLSIRVRSLHRQVFSHL